MCSKDEKTYINNDDKKIKIDNEFKKETKILKTNVKKS